MVKNNSKLESPKKTAFFNALFAFIFLVALNILSGFYFTRFDLTTDKRFSLNKFTINQLEELEDVVFVRVYLEGELPAGFLQLRNATQETLDEMRVFAGDNLQYEFINPSENPDAKIRQNVYRELSKKGLKYTDLTTQKGDKKSEQIVFPGAILTYRDKEIPIQLLKNTTGTNPNVMLNNSIQQLEYEISSTIKKATTKLAKKIAFIHGHGEAQKNETNDIARSLGEFYQYQHIEINGQLNALNGFDAIAIVGPDSAFPEKDKFIIDQFIMAGGKALWFMENVTLNQDSLKKNGISIGLAKNNNLNDQLFNYGVRINSDFVMDMQALPIPVITGMVGNQPKQELFPWYYYPLIFNTVSHPITKNVDAIASQYVSSIDTVGPKYIKKTPLLFTSKYSKVTNAPTRVSLNILRDAPDERRFNSKKQIVGILLEGKFQSLYKNRVPKQISETPEFNFKEQGVENKMIVVSSSSVIKNALSADGTKFMDLGYYKYTNRIYGNKEFVLNAFSYLLEEDELIFSRIKEFKLRLLNQPKIQKESRTWQIFNTATPILFIVLVGGISMLYRKRKYAKHSINK